MTTKARKKEDIKTNGNRQMSQNKRDNTKDS